MSIAALIRADLEMLSQEFATIAKGQLPAAQSMTDEELRNSVREMLFAIADDLEAEQSLSQQAAKAQGKLPEHAPQLTRHARQHAAQRLEQGFTLDQLALEYRALRASLARRLPALAPSLKDVIRLNESLDQALLESVRWYGTRVEHARELFLGALGHDLRTPLATALLSTEIILRDAPPGSRSASAAMRARNSLARMGRMIEDLLDFARTRLGTRLPMQPTRTELTAIVQQAIDELRTVHPGRELKFISHGLLWGQWDAQRLAQMLTNIIGNALQYGDPAHPVIVQTQLEPDHLRITVHNEGKAIPQEALERIFEPLTRLAAADEQRHATHSGTGLGLGLYVSREIARAHGGSIEASSSPEHGTTFTVKLPRLDP